MRSLRRTWKFGVVLAVFMTSSAWGGTVRLETKPDRVLLRNGDLDLTVSLQCPKFEIGDTSVGGASPSAVKGAFARGGTVQADYTPIPVGDSTLEVRLFAKWYPRENVLRKWADYRLAGGTTKLVKEIVLDDMDVSNRHVKLDISTPQSLPAFMDGFFAGIEFPMASTRMEGIRLILAHRPGLRLHPGEWHQTRKAVFGIAPPGREREAFERYITTNRPGPKGLHINYNSWWTSPVPYKESDILATMNTFAEKLFKPHGVSFDTFCIDMGWSNTKDPWEIDPVLFPEGFTRIQKAAQEMGSHLGLWISPSSRYAGAVDNALAGQHGFEILPDAPGGGACLAGYHYRTRLRERLVSMVTQYGIRHIKFDGYWFECPESGHGHAPGALSSEAIADGMISVTDAVRKAAPDTWMESTCFGWNPSPWWLFHVSSVIGTYGDDAPFGRVPAPVYRDSYTTARDYFNLQGADLLPIPIPATEILGIIHQSDDDFMNDAVMTVMRGHMFIPAYVNPKYLSDSRWKAFADLLKWARKNSAQLENTEPLLPKSWQDGKTPRFTDGAVMPREPYGYAHWGKSGGLVALRNPWIEPQNYSLKLDGLPGGRRKWSAVGMYPESRLYAKNLQAGQTLEVPLAPYETVVLSFVPREVDAPPVARQSTVSIVSAEPSTDDSAFSLKTTIKVEAPIAELLVLMDGRKGGQAPAARLLINGVEQKMTAQSSDEGWAASGLHKPEYWLFLRAALQPGVNSIDLSVPLGAEKDLNVSAWVVTSKQGERKSGAKDALPQPEIIRLDAVKLTGRK